MTDTNATSHEQLVDDMFAVYNGDFSKREVFAGSIHFVDPLAEVQGRDELEAFIREMRTAFPGLQLTWTDTLASDDVVMVEWPVTGTHDGEFNGVPPTGNEVEQQGMEKYLIAENKVQEADVYFDQHEMLTQLGLTEEEGPVSADYPSSVSTAAVSHICC